MPAGYCAFVLRQLGTTPEIAGALLEGLGVSPAELALPDAEITLGQQLRQLQNANRLLPPGWALGVGTAFQPSTHGPLGIATISAPTLHAGLDVLRRFTHVRNPSHRVRLNRIDSDVRLGLEECLALRTEERLPLVETFLLSLQGLVEIVLGRAMTAGRFEIGAPEPSYAAQYRAHFHAAVQFDAKTTAMVIPADWLTIPSPFADRGMYAAAVSSLERLARRFERVEYAPADVEHLMAVSADETLPLAEAARFLGVSQRTLVRRLGAAGTSYRSLRDAHRCRRADELLREGTLTVAEVAYRLGYQDAVNFTRACRRWFGAPPGKLRGKGDPSRSR